MDAKELMIGDWVLLNGEPKKVMEILFGSITIDCYPIEECYIEPIPLTPEILEKNGFVKVFRGRYRFEDNSSIVEISISNSEIKQVCVSKYDKNLTTILNCLFTNMKYVHELQHALKLCGIEKNIEL